MCRSFMQVVRELKRSNYHPRMAVLVRGPGRDMPLCRLVADCGAAQSRRLLAFCSASWLQSLCNQPPPCPHWRPSN